MPPKLDPIARIIAISAVVPRFALACATDLSPDEAYYLAAARLHLPIPDHPPLIIWIAQGSEHFHFLPIELRTRLFPLVFGTLTSLALLHCSRLMGHTNTSQRWVALLASWLALPLAGGFLLTPDSPFAFGLCLLLWANLSDSRTARVASLVTAVLLPLAKVAALPILAALAFPSKARRFHLFQFALALPLALFLSLPSLRFQTHHAYGNASLSLTSALSALLAAIGAQLVLWTPLVLWFALRDIKRAPKGLASLIVSFGTLLLLSAIIRGVPPEPNWFVPVALPALLVATPVLATASTALKRTTALLGPALTLLALSHCLLPWIPIPRKSDPTARLHGWTIGSPPLDAPGLGDYAVAAEQCVYSNSCTNITSFINALRYKYQVH
jgi:hypothetical protein